MKFKIGDKVRPLTVMDWGSGKLNTSSVYEIAEVVEYIFGGSMLMSQIRLKEVDCPPDILFNSMLLELYHGCDDSHSWTSYQGFTDAYDFCTRCNEKRK